MFLRGGGNSSLVKSGHAGARRAATKGWIASAGSKGLAALVCLVVPAAATAQEFRVYTRLFDVRAASRKDAKDRDRPISRTTTLFHAGKVYDDIDGGTRVTLFEPAQDRFLLFDGTRRLRATVESAQVEQAIDQALRAARERLNAAAQNSDASRVALVRFQLDPGFQQSFDAARNRLVLSSAVMVYHVQGAAPASKPALAAYLNYADWAARLNYLVNPQALLPGPRLALNKALKERGLLPIEVTMSLEQPQGPRLRAVHRFEWKLDESDRRSILHWERQASSTDWKTVPFAEFQQLVLEEAVQARR